MPGLKLIGEVGLDGSGFERGLVKLGSTAAHSMKEFVIGAFGIYTVTEAMHKAVESCDELANASKRLNIGVEQLQVLRKAAIDSGVGFEAMEKALDKLALARQKALGFGPDALKLRAAFGSLGVSAANVAGNMPRGEMLMGPIAEAIKREGAEKLVVALSEIFGRGFGEVVPVLKTDFGELSGEMKKFGALIGADTVAQVKILKDNFNLLNQIIISQLGPALVQLVRIIYESILKLGGNIAGASAFFGAGTAKMGAGEAALTMAKIVGFSLENMFNRTFRGMSQKDAAAILASQVSGTGFILPEAQKSGNLAAAPWEKALADLETRMANLAKDFAHPPNAGPIIPPPPQVSSRMPREDSLIRTGNFLGSSATTVNYLAEQQLRTQIRIEAHVRTLATKAKDNRKQPSGLGDFNATFFPAV